MKILDTDTLTHLFQGHPRTVQQLQQETEIVATTIINRIEILQGRFAMLLRAADGQQLRRAQWLLDQAVQHLAKIPNVIPIDSAAAAEFDRLRQSLHFPRKAPIMRPASPRTGRGYEFFAIKPRRAEDGELPLGCSPGVRRYGDRHAKAAFFLPKYDPQKLR